MEVVTVDVVLVPLEHVWPVAVVLGCDVTGPEEVDVEVTVELEVNTVDEGLVTGYVVV